jgi:Ca-activated chloride channel family protein
MAAVRMSVPRKRDDENREAIYVQCVRAIRGALLLLAAALVAAAFYTSRDRAEATASAQPSADAVRIVFAFSTNLEELLAPLLADFNAARVEVEGRPVFVEGRPLSSGDAETQIADGSVRPHVWSPASSLWGRLLNYEADAAYVADDNPSLVRSPVVIAMWEPLARALGWPRRPIGFRDVLRLATTKSSWAAYGKPTYGRFKLGHTNPDFSTSGLSFVAAQYFTAAGKREGLTLEDIQRPEIRGKVRAIQQSIVHYGDTGSFFAEQLAAKGPGFASAVAMEETTLLEFNEERRPGSPRLVAIYPAEGGFVADNPYMVLDAPWVTDVHKKAGVELGRWLADRLTPELVARFHYRPGDPDRRPLPPVTRANGADPAQPRRELSLPQPRVLARIKQAWHEDRKAANVLLVVDVSGSMTDEDKIGQARVGLDLFLGQLSPRDRVGLMAFAFNPIMLVLPAPFAANNMLLTRTVSELIADGDTALYDATLRGWQAVDALRDDSRINAVVVLSDGADNASGRRLEDVLVPLRARSSGEGRQIRIFTIAYGSDANLKVLEQIAAASGGKAYTGDPRTIKDVYLQISSFF